MSKVIPMALVMVALVLSSGCAGRASSPSVSPTPRQPAGMAETRPEEATSAVEASLGSPDECLACHADKQKLIDTAAPVEVAPSESSGVG